jgi:hypothetical protein
MSDSTVISLNSGHLLPEDPCCETCGIALAEPYGWCTNCRAAYCLSCGRRHFCTPACPANGCLAGLCVRMVEHGVLAETWGLPSDEEPATPRR